MISLLTDEICRWIISRVGKPIRRIPQGQYIIEAALNRIELRLRAGPLEGHQLLDLFPEDGED
jgi:hypothetical protein